MIITDRVRQWAEFRQWAVIQASTNRVVAAFLWLCAQVMLCHPTAAQLAERPAGSLEDVVVDFDWMQHRVTVADLAINLNLPFQHGTPNLTVSETAAYRELILTINERRYAAQFDAAGDALSEAATQNAWETAFYKYEAARRKAWSNGQFELRELVQNPADPFAASTEIAAGRSRPFRSLNSRVPYSLMADISTYPDEFVGRPVVIYGMYVSSGQFEIPVSENTAGIDLPAIRLQRGILKDLLNSKTMAIVDAAGYIGPGNQLQPHERWPAEAGVAIPVLVKGWFIKRWGQHPLIMTQAIRILYPQPYNEVIRLYTKPRLPLTADEKWIYYETLRQLQLTNATAQAKRADANSMDRINTLMSEIRDKAVSEKTLLEQDLSRQRITEEQFRTRKLRLERQVAFRLDRYESYLTSLNSFPLYVDIFQHPEEWSGKLATLSGHVRRTVSYAGDVELFSGQPLHELWLFTDDSQNNPAVVITPTLPKDFPVNAEVVDRVTVTGCFFKPYVYRAEGDHRVAPLMLAGRINWSPTDDQILSLTAEGSLPANSTLAIAASRRNTSRQLSDSGVMLLGFLALIVMMMIWGRVQRDRRERRRLLELVETQQDFDQHLIDPVLARYREVP